MRPGQLTNMRRLAAFYPNPYPQVDPGQRAAATKGNPGLARHAFAPSEPPTVAAFASLHIATRCARLAPRGLTKRPEDTAGFESRTECPRSRARLRRSTTTDAYGAHAKRRLGDDRRAADRAQRYA